jgi:hypothetical protein
MKLSNWRVLTPMAAEAIPELYIIILVIEDNYIYSVTQSFLISYTFTETVVLSEYLRLVTQGSFGKLNLRCNCLRARTSSDVPMPERRLCTELAPARTFEQAL